MIPAMLDGVKDAIDQGKRELAAETSERIRSRLGSALRRAGDAALKATLVGFTVLNYKAAEAQIDPMHVIRAVNDSPVLATAAVFSIAMGGTIYLTLLRKDD